MAQGRGHVASVAKVNMILLIDNFDSFVHNLARYFQRLGQVTRVVRNNAISVAEIRELNPAAIVLSPGPCIWGWKSYSRTGTHARSHEPY
jgi:anthranilate/para-aminobenzoate synthase component II